MKASCVWKTLKIGMDISILLRIGTEAGQGWKTGDLLG